MRQTKFWLSVSAFLVGSVSPRYRGQLHGHAHDRNVDDHFGRYFNVSPEKIGLAPILLSNDIAHLPTRGGKQ